MPSIFNSRKVTVRHYLPCYLHNRFNRLYSDEIVHMLQLAKPKLILCDISVLETLNSALKELQMDRPVFAFDGSADGVQNVEVLFNETDVESFVYEFDLFCRMLLMKVFMLSYLCSAPPLIDANKHTAVIVCTSGSTGLPKAVCLSHVSLLAKCIKTGYMN